MRQPIGVWLFPERVGNTHSREILIQFKSDRLWFTADNPTVVFVYRASAINLVEGKQVKLIDEGLVEW